MGPKNTSEILKKKLDKTNTKLKYEQIEHTYNNKKTNLMHI